MVEDSNASPHDFRYNRPRAVSLLVTQDLLFASHGTKIYVFYKRTLAEQRQVTVDLPCRLIQVRRGAPPGTDIRYGVPQDCYTVWAVGAMYIGNGQKLDKFKTSLYKLAIV